MFKSVKSQFYASLAWLMCICVFEFRVSELRAEPTSADRWWSENVERALQHAVTNRVALETALRSVPVSQRDGLQFLVENMPEPDLRSLSSDFLLENTALAYEALNAAPWKEQISKELFLNDVLPYASVNEKRDAWRRRLRDLSAPLVAGCKTPSEVARRLNEKLFASVGVKYSTQRKKACQSPLETMESGLATCTGLSILLVDACRSVGVPARVVGTPLWINLRGNHTWVEIWDEGWHCAGAAEPDPQGLDRGWFLGDASQARKDEPKHAIYASSFAKTGLSFPMVWSRNTTWVSAVNVTDHYTPKAVKVDPDKTRLLVKVLDRPAGRRVAAKLRVVDTSDAAAVQEGVSKDETADLNNFQSFEVRKEHSYQVRVELGDRKVTKDFRTGTNAQELIVLELNEETVVALPTQACYVRPKVAKPLKSSESTKLKKALADYFAATSQQRANWKFSSSLEKLLRDNEPATRQAAWEAYCAAPLHTALKQDYDNKQVRFDKYLSPYTVKTVGTRPANGWPLFIAMHGGGGAPKRVNDSQWQHMQIYYRDQPEAGGYLYVALRAPNDTWNGFYDDYVYPLVGNLVRQFRLFGDVDPNKVFIMGYSHGGYGAFAIGPKMPDHFAAIHASAAAPTDGETTAKTLRNTIFTCMVGEKDTDYGRYERNQRFRDALAKLRGDRTNIYPVTVQVIAGHGHSGLPDRDKIRDMYPAVRNPVPRELTWLMTDRVIKDFFWLYVPNPSKEQELIASCQDNRITVTTTPNVASATVLLDDRLIDFDQPVALEVNGRTSKQKLKPGLRTLCETLLRRGDPDLAFTAQLELPIQNRHAKK